MSWLTLYKFDPSATDESCKKYSNPSWAHLSLRWREKFGKEQELGNIPMAAYAIAICPPFTIAYPNDHSPIVYVGEGMAHMRFAEHLREKLLPMVETRLQAEFDFWVLPCGPGEKQMVQATEARMLTHFEQTYGAKPLFNQQAGKTVAAEPHPDWFVPMDHRRRGKRRWKITEV